MSMKGSSQKFSTDELRKFYFSRATDFGAFHAHESSAAGVNNASTVVNRSTVGKTPSVSPIPAASSSVPAADETTSPTGTSAAPVKPVAAAAPVAAGSAVQAARRQQGGSPTTANATAVNATALNESKAAGSVSTEYMTFLRQQQDILNAHQDAESTIRAALMALQQHRAEQDDVVAHATELLRAAESSTSWGWKSKFTKDTLRRDAELDVDFEELCRKEDVPNVVELQQQQHQLQRLKQELAAAVKQLQAAAGAMGADADAAATSMANRLAPFGPLLEAGLRRVEVLLRDFSQSNIDASPIVRLADTLLMQLDHALGVAPLSRVLQDANDRLRVAEQRRAECLAVRERALDEGTMDVAERASFQLAELSESCTAAVQEKLRLISHVAEEHAVVETVCKSYADQFQQATASLDDETATKKRRCEDDLARLYGLKKKVADVETAAAARWEAERVASDDRLSTLETRRADVWTQLLALAQQLDTIEADRHMELKRRVEEKVKDEGRRSEYAVFVATVAEVAESLDRTVRNMELRQQGTRFMADFVQGGFGTVQRDISHHRAEVQAELLAAHEQHLAAFRELLFVLGDLEYKKEKRVEELGAQVQTAHIQQELCNDSLNPQAKRFSDQKKDLLSRRDGVEQEVRALRDRQETAVAKFAPTEAALTDAGAMPRHPLTELEEWRLNTRARMVEFKALALGGVASAPLRAELETLTRTLDESRQLVRSVQNRTTI